jgi:hypothetical protein
MQIHGLLDDDALGLGYTWPFLHFVAGGWFITSCRTELARILFLAWFVIHYLLVDDAAVEVGTINTSDFSVMPS